MRIWLSKNSDVPLREQLATQILLGIVSQDLKPGQKLPSTRELAHRYDIHSNTVSAAYRDLAHRGWVEFRKGSGVYVRNRIAEAEGDPTLELDQLVSTLFQVARERGYSLREIQRRIKRWLEAQPPDHFLVIEPDVEMREVLIAEIGEATGFRTMGASIEDCSKPELLAGAAPVAMFGVAEQIRAALPAGTPCLYLRLRSVPASMAGQERPAPDTLVSVVSRWPEFLKWAHTVLVAAAIDPEALSFRDAREPGWQKGLASSGLIITDSLTAKRLPRGCRPRVFRIIADSSIDDLNKIKPSSKSNPRSL